MSIIIRHERFEDFRNVENLARDAFWNLYFPGAHEHFVVHRMRNHPDFIPELSFVLEIGGKVQGAIYYTHSHILYTLPSGHEQKLNTISFGPMFIAPALHRQGFGRKLINHSLAVAKEYGHGGVITLGYPYHYAPYGFVGGKKYGIAMGDGNFYTGLLALELRPNALDLGKNITGQAVFSSVFEVSTEEVDAFDAGFSPKQKAVQASQQEFEQACMELDV